jgi:hypothetical protein
VLATAVIKINKQMANEIVTAGSIGLDMFTTQGILSTRLHE